MRSDGNYKFNSSEVILALVGIGALLTYAVKLVSCLGT